MRGPIVCVVVSALALTACSGGLGRMTPTLAPLSALPAAGSSSFAPLAKSKSKLKVTPVSLSLLGTGPANALTATVSEAGYSGKITHKSTCAGIAAVRPATGKGPKQNATVTGSAAGTCAFTFSDSKANTAVLKIGVTTTAVQLKGPLPGSAKSATITLESVNGKPPGKGIVATVTRALKKCASGCTVAGPASPAGKDVFSTTAANAKGVTVADGHPVHATIKPAKANVAAVALTTIGAIEYTCTAGCPSPAPASPELDLYNPTKGQPGYRGSFKLSQAGWSGGGFSNKFTYTLSGRVNNCTSFAVTPASGSSTSFTVAVAASPVAGACTMTVTGAPGIGTLSVRLTYTSNIIGINAKHHVSRKETP